MESEPITTELDGRLGSLRLRNNWSEIQEKRGRTSISLQNSKVRVLSRRSWPVSRISHAIQSSLGPFSPSLHEQMRVNLCRAPLDDSESPEHPLEGHAIYPAPQIWNE